MINRDVLRDRLTDNLPHLAPSVVEEIVMAICGDAVEEADLAERRRRNLDSAMAAGLRALRPDFDWRVEVDRELELSKAQELRSTTKGKP